MKTSLAIILAAAAALTVSATVNAAIAGYSNKGLCGLTACTFPDQVPIIIPRQGPGSYRGQM
jgi:hypothetical protein